MRKTSLFVMAVTALLQTGCVFVRLKAATVLKIRTDKPASECVSVGFRDTKWAVLDGRITLVGYGWHHREHETYAFVMSEPSSYDPRWLLIQGDGTASNAIIRVRWPLGGQALTSSFSPEAEYQGQIQAFQVTPGKTITLSLRDVPLHSFDNKMHLILSGCVKAKPESQQAVRQMLERAETTSASNARQPN